MEKWMEFTLIEQQIFQKTDFKWKCLDWDFQIFLWLDL